MSETFFKPRFKLETCPILQMEKPYLDMIFYFPFSMEIILYKN